MKQNKENLTHMSVSHQLELFLTVNISFYTQMTNHALRTPLRRAEFLLQRHPRLLFSAHTERGGSFPKWSSISYPSVTPSYHQTCTNSEIFSPLFLSFLSPKYFYHRLQLQTAAHRVARELGDILV